MHDPIRTFFICYSAATIFILVFMVIDYIVTRYRLKLNQDAWDEFSEGMTFNEKMDAYLPWCDRRRAEMGWEFWYFPRL